MERFHTRQGIGFLLVGEHVIHVVFDQLQEIVTAFLHHVVAGHVDGDFQAGRFGGRNGLIQHGGIGDEVAFHVEDIPTFEEFGTDIVSTHLRGCAETGGKGAFAVGGDQCLHATGRRLAHQHLGFDVCFGHLSLKETPHLIISYFAEEARFDAELGEAAHGVGCRATGGHLVAEISQLFADFHRSLGVDISHAPLR